MLLDPDRSLSSFLTCALIFIVDTLQLFAAPLIPKLAPPMKKHVARSEKKRNSGSIRRVSTAQTKAAHFMPLSMNFHKLEMSSQS